MENEPPFAENRSPQIQFGWLGRIVWSLLGVMLFAFLYYAGQNVYARHMRLEEVRSRCAQIDKDRGQIEREIQAEERRLLECLKARTLVDDVTFVLNSENPEIHREALKFFYHELTSEEVLRRRNAAPCLRVLGESTNLHLAKHHSEICDHLLPLIHDHDPYLAWFALDSLQELQPERSHIANELELLATHPGHPLAAKAVAALLAIDPQGELPVYAQLRLQQGTLPWFRYRQTVYFPDPNLEKDPEVKAILEKIEADEMRMYQRSRSEQR